MYHYSNDKSEKGDQMLDDEEFVGEIPKGCQGAEVEPEQDSICGDATWWTTIRGPFHMH